MFESWLNPKARGVPQVQAVATAGGVRVLGAEGTNRERVDPEAVLRRLEWTVLRRLDGLLQRLPPLARWPDLADLREYQTHDDVRYMDWNTARLQIPACEFQEDREITAGSCLT